MLKVAHPSISAELHPCTQRGSQGFVHDGGIDGLGVQTRVGGLGAGHKALEGCIPHHLREVRGGPCHGEEGGQIKGQPLCHERTPPLDDFQLCAIGGVIEGVLGGKNGPPTHIVVVGGREPYNWTWPVINSVVVEVRGVGRVGG